VLRLLILSPEPTAGYRPTTALIDPQNHVFFDLSQRAVLRFVHACT